MKALVLALVLGCWFSASASLLWKDTPKFQKKTEEKTSIEIQEEIKSANSEKDEKVLESLTPQQKELFDRMKAVSSKIDSDGRPI